MHHVFNVVIRMANAPRTCPRLHIAEPLSTMLFFHSRFVSLEERYFSFYRAANQWMRRIKIHQQESPS